MRRTLILLCAFTLLVAHAAPARANPAPKDQPPLYVVILATERDRDLDRLAEIANDVDRALARAGVDRVPYASAASVFSDRHSREPQPVSQADLNALPEQSEALVRAVVTRRLQQAIEQGRKLREHLDAVLESLNRDRDAAAEYLAICATHVRAILATGNRDDAKRTAQQCRNAVPDLKPAPNQTPPEVVELFNQVDNEAASSTGVLVIRTDHRPGSPTGSPCTVYSQGRPVGHTPLPLTAPVGERYRIQVECGGPQPGRVHSVTIREEATRLVVDPALEAAVRTSGALLRLVYDRIDPDTEDVLRHDAYEIAKAIGATDALVVAIESPRTVRVRHAVKDWGFEADLPEPYSEEQLQHELTTLLQRVDARRAEGDRDEVDAETTVSVPPPATKAGASRKRVITAVGAAATAAGATLFALSAWRHKAWRDDGVDLRSHLSTGFSDRQQAWRDGRTAPYALAAAGAVLSSVGAGLLASRASLRTARWLAPVLAAAGATLLTVGVVDITKGDSCEPVWESELARCIEGHERRDRGGLLTLSATPLLVAPAVLLIKSLQTDPAPHVQAGLLLRSGRPYAHLSWRF